MRNRGFYSTGSKRSVPRLCRVFRGNTGASGEDDFPENRLRLDLAQPVKARSYLCLWNGICGYSCFSFLAGYALASPADMYLALPVTFPDQQAIDDGHSDVKLLEDV